MTETSECGVGACLEIRHSADYGTGPLPRRPAAPHDIIFLGKSDDLRWHALWEVG